MKIMIIFERFIVLMWKNLNFQLFCFCYSVVYVRTVFTEAQPGPTLTALYFEIAYSLLRKIPEREFQILTLMNFHEPLEIKCNFQRPSSSDSPLCHLLLRWPWIYLLDQLACLQSLTNLLYINNTEFLCVYFIVIENESIVYLCF